MKKQDDMLIRYQKDKKMLEILILSKIQCFMLIRFS